MNLLQNPLYIRGDFHVCPTPLAFDPYRGCLQRCTYCFCRELEHRFSPNDYTGNIVKNANLQKVKHIFKLAFGSRKESRNPVVNALRTGFPVALGKKTEPFQPLELERGITLECLKLLKDYDVPTIIETKHIYLGLDKYLKIISEMDVAINVSIISGSMSKICLLEPKTPLTDHRWKLVRKLKEMGFWVGVRNEPILLGMGSTEKNLSSYAKRAIEIGVDHVNFGNYRVFDPKMAYGNFVSAGLGEEYKKMLRLNETKKWRETGEFLFDLLRKGGVKATSSDWDTFHDLNDCENCCGIDDKFPKFNKFTFQHALRIIKERGDVTWADIERESSWLTEAKIEKIKGIWNMENSRYYTLKDAHFIGVAGRDSERNLVFKKQRKRTLKDVFA